MADGVLSEALRADLGEDAATSVGVNQTARRRKRVAERKAREELTKNGRRQRSKKERRKLRKLEEAREQKARREKLYASLSQTKLKDAHLDLMHTSHQLGQRATKRMRLERAFRERAAGIANEDEGLLVDERERDDTRVPLVGGPPATVLASVPDQGINESNSLVEPEGDLSDDFPDLVPEGWGDTGGRGDSSEGEAALSLDNHLPVRGDSAANAEYPAYQSGFLDKPMQMMHNRKRRRRKIILDLPPPESLIAKRDATAESTAPAVQARAEEMTGDSADRCPEGHPLIHASLEALIRESGGYKNGYTCSVCEGEQPAGAIDHHCSKCLFDVCKVCFDAEDADGGVSGGSTGGVSNMRGADDTSANINPSASRGGYTLSTRVSNNPFIYASDAGRIETDQKNKKSRMPESRRLVRVSRTREVEAQREGLPVCSMEQEIVEAIFENDVVIVCGETGSGKTTQIPQFLYEAGFGKADGGTPGIVGVTEPRRVAAVSTAQRVATELNVEFKSIVTYQVRFDAPITGAEKIKFMTDGILLRELESDVLLSKYSAVVIDEAHERGLNTDVLLGLLSRVVQIRRRMQTEKTSEMSADTKAGTLLPPLKLIIMSATLNVKDLVENDKLFPPTTAPPRLIQVPSRQHPVTVHFNKKTELKDYFGAVKKKVCKIHRQLPPGGILVFLTGKHEIERMCRELCQDLTQAAGPKNYLSRGQGAGKHAEKVGEGDNSTALKEGSAGAESDGGEEDLDRGQIEESDSEEELTPEAKQRTEADLEDMKARLGGDDVTGEGVGAPARLRVLPLYSSLPTREQMRVFEPVDAEVERLVVVATNVAETSLTIPGIRYVVDSGRCKRRVYLGRSGASRFEIQWVSQAAAKQRAGRAGRTGPGHCYRVYSSAAFTNALPDFEPPEILISPIESTVLSMKAMEICDVAGFPFPTPPPVGAVRSAEALLTSLGAIERLGGGLTPLGRAMARFPVSPRFGRMLVLADQKDCLPYVVAIAASYAAEELFLPEPSAGGGAVPGTAGDETADALRARRAAQKAYHRVRVRWQHQHSDLLARLRVVGALEWAVGRGKAKRFQRTNFLRPRSLREVALVGRQLNRVVATLVDDSKKGEPRGGLGGAREDSEEAEEREEAAAGAGEAHVPRATGPPSPEQELLLRQIITAGFMDRVARKLTRQEFETLFGTEEVPEDGAVLSPDGAYVTVLGGAVGADGVGGRPALAYIHPRSSLFAEDRQPAWLVYREIIETTKRYMRDVTAIEPSWLPLVGASHCSDSAPLDDPAPVFNAKKDRVECFVRSTFGPLRWPLPLRKKPMPAEEEELHSKPLRHFARLLLRGAVCPALKEFRPYLSTRPSALLAPVPTAKARRLLAALARAGGASREALRRAWQRDPKFLFPEYVEWVQWQKRKRLESVWPLLAA